MADGVPLDLTPLDAVTSRMEYEMARAGEMAQVVEWWTPATVVATPPEVALTEDEEAYRTALAEAGVVVSEQGWVHPATQARYASGYGFRGGIPGLTSAGLHNGVDLAAPAGYPIRAASAGTVIYTGNGARQYGLSGWVVAIDHGNGIVTTYNHMYQAGVLVTKGQEVREGEIIALVGSSGRSTGPHLHFSVRMNGATVDPVDFMLSRGIDLKAGRAVRPVPMTADVLAAHAKYREQAASLPAASGSTGSTRPGAGGEADVTPSPTAPATPTPSATGTATPTPAPSGTGTPTPEPSTQPTATPTGEPTTEPTTEPSTQPTTAPTGEPTTSPTGTPTTGPTTEPTTEPTTAPTTAPTGSPSPQPTSEPTEPPPTDPGPSGEAESPAESTDSATP